MKFENEVLLKIAKIDFLKDFHYKIRTFRKNHIIFTRMIMKASTRSFNIKVRLYELSAIKENCRELRNSPIF